MIFPPRMIAAVGPTKRQRETASNEAAEKTMRYLPLSPDDRSEMLAKIGVDAIDDLFADVPADKLLTEPLDLPRRKGEMEVERILGRMAGRNVTASSVPFFVGAGAYKHHVPATVDHVIQRSEFLTSYTPYQPEIAQGTLQYLFEFQTQVAALTGMDVANASMYDGSTAAGEAVLMAHRVTKRGKAVLSGGLHPHYAEVIETLSEMANDSVVRLPADVMADEDIVSAIDDETSCVVVQTPDVFGNLRDLTKIAESACPWCAPHRRLYRGDVAWPDQAARRDGRRYRRGRRPVDRQQPEFRRPLCRALRRAPEAGAPVRRDGGCRGQARLRADALHPRAAYPP